MTTSLPALLICTFNGSGGVDVGGAGAISFVPMMQGGLGTVISTEAYNQHKIEAAGNLGNWGIKVDTNGRSTATTFKDKKNGSNASLSVSVGAGLTGFFEDTSTTSAYSAGDLMSGVITCGSGTGSFKVKYCRGTFKPTTGVVNLFGGCGESENQFAANNYYCPTGQVDSIIGNSTDAAYALYQRAGGTYSNMQIYIRNNNTQTGNSTVKSRINTSAGNQLITIGAGLSGLFEDTSHSDTITNSDIFQLWVQVGSTSFNLYQEYIGCLFTSTSTKTEWVLNRTKELSISNTAANYMPVCGSLDVSLGTTESDAQTKIPFDCRLANMRLLHLYDFSQVSTVRLRQNGANGNQVVVVPLGTTLGLIEDTSSHDDILSGDLVDYSYVTISGGSMYMHVMAITAEPPPTIGGGGGQNLIIVNQ